MTKTSDPGPGERSGLSSAVAAELLDGLPAAAGPAPAAEVTAGMPEFGVGDDPSHPIHGTMAEEFEQNLD